MEKLKAPRPIIEIPIKPEIELVRFEDYLNKNSFLIHQCEDSDVLFHVSFLTASHAIEKAMLFLRQKPNFDSFKDFFTDCNNLIFSYQSMWLNKNANENWREESLKIAENLSPTFVGRNRVNEAINIYMDKYFLFDTISSELRRILKLSTQERKLIIQNGIPFLKRTIRLAELEPIEMPLLENKPKFPLVFS
ncbi:MAG: hypothetical protein GQ547_07005 [Methylophaga sp.]|nr:hypothetical protein [Methylophaga sp.]